MPDNVLPRNELEVAAAEIRAKPWLSDQEAVLSVYEQHAKHVVADANDFEISNIIVSALSQKTSLSVIRMGECEVNQLTLEQYPLTPNINTTLARASIARRKDRFEPDSSWLIRISKIMQRSVRSADVIGVRGFWPQPPFHLKFEEYGTHVEAGRDLRAYLGTWRSVDYMIKLAMEGAFAKQTVTSMHLYLSVLHHLPLLFGAVSKVFIIGCNNNIVESLARQFPRVRFFFIPVGLTRSDCLPKRPDFLFSTVEKLPAEMRGTLTLIGAGLWAEWYATKIKQRGGVAVDIGSGMDLLRGKCTRPIHRRLGLDRDNSLARIQRARA